MPGGGGSPLQLFFLLLLSLTASEALPFTLGAILREKQDAHIAAALHYAVDFIRKDRRLQPVDLRIEYVNPHDHFGAINRVCTLVEKQGAIAVVGTSDASLNEQLARVTSQMDVPLLSVIDDPGLPFLAGRIDLFPHLQLFDAIVDLFRYWKWNRITIVYEDVGRVRRLEPLLMSDQYNNIRFTLVKVTAKDYMKAAREVEEAEECRVPHKKDCSEFSRVLLDLNPQQTYNFLLAALRVGLIELKHWFLLTSMELSTIDMELFRHNHARFISPNPVDLQFERTRNGSFSFSHFHQHVKQIWNTKTGNDLDFRLMESVFAFDAVWLYSHAVRQLQPAWGKQPRLQTPPGWPALCRRPGRLPRPTSHGKLLEFALSNVDARGLSGDLRRLSGHVNKTSFTMRIQLLGYSGTLDDIGIWEPTTDVNVNMSLDSRAQLQKNVQVSDELKPHFRVTTILERPYVMLRRNHYELGSSNKLEGFCIDLLHELSRDLGFTFSIHLVKDGKYGSDTFNNGSWDGMIGEILRGEVEMAVAPLTVNFRRAEVVDFTKPFLSLGIAVLFKVPSDQQPDLFSFLNPLSWQIWLSILAAIVGVTLGMFVVARITPHEWNLNFSCCTAHQPHPAASFTPADSAVQLSNNYSFFNTLWYVTSTMLKGGCDFGPRALSTRLLGGMWWVFTLVIISAYTANLAAVLTVSRPFIPIKNLDDLANQTVIKYGTIKDGSTMQFFKESKIGSHTKMWDYMKGRDVFVPDNGNGVDRVLRDNYAFLMESTSLEFEVQQNCNLTQIGGVLGSKGYGIALHRGSEWTDRISRQILLYAKRGILEMKKTKWWRSKSGSCSASSGAVKEQRLSLSIHNVAGLFIILSVGLLVGVGTVVCELIIRARQISKKESNSMGQEVRQELRYALNLDKVEDHRSRRRERKSSSAPPPLTTANAGRKKK